MDNENTGLERKLSDTAAALIRARDEYHGLIMIRDELILSLIDLGYSRADVARMAGVKPHQISRMVTGTRND